MSQRIPPSIPLRVHPRAVRWQLALLALALLVVGVGALALVGSSPHRLASSLRGTGAPLLVGAAMLLSLALVPASLIAAAVGALAGLAAGLPIALTGLGISAALAAAMTRASSRSHGSAVLGSRAVRASSWLERRPLRAVIVARAIPGAPFGPISYSLGLTRIRLRTVLVGSVLGFAPRALIYTATGTAISNPHRLTGQLGVIGSLTLLGISLVAMPLGARARKRFNRGRGDFDG